MQAVLEALAVTAELCGAELSDAAAKVMVADLSVHPEADVLLALTRLRHEHKGRLSLAAIIERLPDDRPGPEEAWGMLPKDEYTTAVLTDEINAAAEFSMPIFHDGDKVGARMAFREAYVKAVAENKARGVPVRWVVSLGWDKDSRLEPLADAVKLGRISEPEALRHVGGYEARLLALTQRGGVPEVINLAGVMKALEQRGLS